MPSQGSKLLPKRPTRYRDRTCKQRRQVVKPFSTKRLTKPDIESMRELVKASKADFRKRINMQTVNGKARQGRAGPSCKGAEERLVGINKLSLSPDPSLQQLLPLIFGSNHL